MKTVKEVYCNGAGYTKVWFSDELEACVNEVTLEISGLNHIERFRTFGLPVELTQEQIDIAKQEYNQYWKDWNQKYTKHARPLFQIIGE